MIKVLFDTNIILDVALQREPFVKNSTKAVNLVGEKVVGFINVLTLVNTFYFARKEVGIDKAREFIGDLLNCFELVNISKQVCIDALSSNFKDFEDAVQEYSAKNSDIQIIVTRNLKDFQNSQLHIFEPTKFIDWVKNKPLN